MAKPKPDSLRARWMRERAVDRWRRQSHHWWLPGRELSFTEVGRTWREAHDSDDAALGHVVLVLDRYGMLDDSRPRNGR